MSYSTSVAELLNAIGITANASVADITLLDITADSRKVSEGAIFCAYPGAESDGRDYIDQALQAGAALVICEASEYELSAELAQSPIVKVDNLQQKVGILAAHFFQQPSQDMQVFGITGTNGKTTCCYLLAQALNALGNHAAMMGTIGTGELNDLAYGKNQLTTPDAISVQRLLAEWRDQGFSHACMEVSSHALEQGRVAGVTFFATLFTNLSHDHLDFHGDMASYAAAKQKLFTEFHSELVITNADDNLGASLVDIANSDFIASFGVNGDVSLQAAELSAKGIQLDIKAGDVEFTVTTPLVGKVNIPNVLQLVTTLLSLSIDLEQIIAIVAQLKPAPGRMELFQQHNQFDNAPRVVIDFAHTPDALEKALLSIREHCAGELWCVFGCGGDRDQAKRPVMGEVANRYADRLVVTNDNPRTESAQIIAEQILQGIKGDVLVELDRAAAIRLAITNAQNDDWVLIAGKGHESTQHIGDQLLPFSDREQVAEIFGVAA